MERTGEKDTCSKKRQNRKKKKKSKGKILWGNSSRFRGWWQLLWMKFGHLLRCEVSLALTDWMPPSIPHSCLYVDRRYSELNEREGAPALKFSPGMPWWGSGLQGWQENPKRQAATLDQRSSLLPCRSKKQVQETMFLNVPLNFNLELSTFNNLNCEVWKTQ